MWVIKMKISDRLKEIRTNRSFSRKQAAEFLNMPYSTYTNYESGLREPASDILLEISDKYGVTIDYLLGKSDESHPITEVIKTFREQILVQKYRDLSDAGKSAIDKVLNSLSDYERAFRESTATYCENIIDLPTRHSAHYEIGASAGTGNLLEDCPYSIIEIGPEAPMQTSFTVDVDGDSMEPLFHDGDLLYVRDQDYVNDGEIGLFHYDGQVFVKKLEHRNGKAFLVSLNPTYQPIEIDANLEFACLGKVLNK